MSECRRTSCPVPSSERAQVSNFRTHSIPNLWTHPMSIFWTYLFAVRLCHTLPAANGVAAVLLACRSALVLAASTRCLRRAHSIGRGCSVHSCVMAIGADFKMYLLRQFCTNRVEFFFYNTQETQMQKMMDQNFEIRFLWFLRIFEIYKKASCGPSEVIWTIMVTAKLDQSRVLVTKFRQNRSTMKGKSAGQRRTDRQTNTAENNVSSGLQ